MIKKILVFTFLAAALLNAGCAKQKNPVLNADTAVTGTREKGAKKDKKIPQVGISIATDTFIIERWNKDIKILSSEIASRGGQVVLQLSAGGTDAQIRQINYLLTQNIDALVVVAHDSDMLAGVIKQVNDKGIPVVAYDRMINGIPLSAYVSFNSRKVGSLMAKALLCKVPCGKYLVLNGSKRDHNSYEISRGIHEVLDPQIAADNIVINQEIWLEEWSFDEALVKLEAAFAETGEPEAIIAANDQLAEAAIQILAERRLAGTVPVVGQDADLSACQRIVEGLQLITVYKPISSLASKAAEITMALINGKLPEPDSYVQNNSGFDIPFFTLNPIPVYAENMDDTIIRDGFHSAEDIYRKNR